MSFTIIELTGEIPSFDGTPKCLLTFMSGTRYLLEIKNTRTVFIGDICTSVSNKIYEESDDLEQTQDCYLIYQDEILKYDLLYENIDNFDNQILEFNVLVYDISVFKRIKDTYSQDCIERKFADNYRGQNEINIFYCPINGFKTFIQLLESSPFIDTIELGSENGQSQSNDSLINKLNDTQTESANTMLDLIKTTTKANTIIFNLMNQSSNEDIDTMIDIIKSNKSIKELHIRMLYSKFVFSNDTFNNIFNETEIETIILVNGDLNDESTHNIDYDCPLVKSICLNPSLRKLCFYNIHFNNITAHSLHNNLKNRCDQIIDIDFKKCSFEEKIENEFDEVLDYFKTIENYEYDIDINH